jgi:hypothetical protein
LTKLTHRGRGREEAARLGGGGEEVAHLEEGKEETLEDTRIIIG